MGGERVKGSSEKKRHILKPEDIEQLFPADVIEDCGFCVQSAPRAGVGFEKVYCFSDLIHHSGCTVWRFSGIAVQPIEGTYLDLSPFDIDLHYFGGGEDGRALYGLLKLIGKPIDKGDTTGFQLFMDKILIGVLGANYPSGYDRKAEKFRPTKQLELFRRAVMKSHAPVLILYGHGDYGYTSSGCEQKVLCPIYPKSGLAGVSLSDYLRQIDVRKYSAIIDLSCTVNPQFCLETFPDLLPENCPPLFGPLDKIDNGFGFRSCDTYCIDGGKVMVFSKLSKNCNQ